MDSLRAFDDLPRRLFLDAFALQVLNDYGSFVFETEIPPPDDRICTVSAGMEELDALRAIFQVNERAVFELALSEHSPGEVHAKADHPSAHAHTRPGAAPAVGCAVPVTNFPAVQEVAGTVSVGNLPVDAE